MLLDSANSHVVREFIYINQTTIPSKLFEYDIQLFIEIMTNKVPEDIIL